MCLKEPDSLEVHILEKGLLLQVEGRCLYTSSNAAQAKPATGNAGSDMGQGLILSSVAMTKYLRLSHLQ